METKPFWQSKTFWVQILGIIAIVVPQSRSFIDQNLGASAGVWAVLNIVLRLISKDKISLS